MGMDLYAHVKEAGSENTYTFAPAADFKGIDFVDLESTSIRATQDVRRFFKKAGVDFYKETEECGCIDIPQERAVKFLATFEGINRNFLNEEEVWTLDALIAFIKVATTKGYRLSIC